MMTTFSELKMKEVINLADGSKLGHVNDLELNVKTAKICSIIVYGRLKCFGLLGREEDTVIKWEDIKTIGEDTILVCIEVKKRPKHEKKLIEKIFE